MAGKTSKDEMTNCIVACYTEFMKDKGDDALLTVPEMELKDMTPLDYINPYKRSWRVSVPYKFKSVFMDENFYPNQWKFRQFYPYRTTRKTNNAMNDSERLLLDNR